MAISKAQVSSVVGGSYGCGEKCGIGCVDKGSGSGIEFGCKML